MTRNGTQKEVQHKATTCNAPSFDRIMQLRASLNAVNGNKQRNQRTQTGQPDTKPGSVRRSMARQFLCRSKSNSTPTKPACQSQRGQPKKYDYNLAPDLPHFLRYISFATEVLDEVIVLRYMVYINIKYQVCQRFTPAGT